MSVPDLLSDASPLQGQAEHSSHYLRAVADMAGRCQVTTREALYNDRGIKLLDQGMRVDSSLYERLVRHRLQGSLDDKLAVQDMVGVPAIVQEAQAQCESDLLASLLVRALPAAASAMAPARLLAPIGALVLPHPLAFRLTVMRTQHPELFSHAVRVMLTSLWLALHAGLDERERVHLAAAALLHDIGELHMAPLWRDPATRVTGAGRKELMAHPITAALVIQAQQLYPRSVVQAVLEHHERMDGSGYPRRLRGEQLSPMGRILLLAEVAAAFFEKYADQGAAQRLSLTLRMGHRRYPADLVAHLLPALDRHAAPATLQVTPVQVQAGIEMLSLAFADWDARCAALPVEAFAPDSGQACSFVTQRLVSLQKILYEVGSHPQQQAHALAFLEGDAQGLAELALLTREALWQLQSIVDAAHSRWPHLATSQDAADQAVLGWSEALAHGAGPPESAVP